MRRRTDGGAASPPPLGLRHVHPKSMYRFGCIERGFEQFALGGRQKSTVRSPIVDATAHRGDGSASATPHVFSVTTSP